LTYGIDETITIDRLNSDNDFHHDIVLLSSV